MDKNSKKLLKAAKQNLFEKVKTLIENNSTSTTVMSKKGRTIGHIAVRNANFNMLKYIVDKDPSILRIEDNVCYNIFHLAVKRGALDMVKYMVEKYNEDIFQKYKADLDDTGTALHRAIKFGYLNMVKYFIEGRNVDVNGHIEDQKQPPLFLAIKYKHPDIVKYLIDEQNANLTLVDCNDENILYESIRKNNLNLIKYLLDEKKVPIDIDSRNNKDDSLVGETMRTYPFKNQILRYLVEQKKANINIFYSTGTARVSKTKPLLFKAYQKYGSMTTVEILIKNGANVNAVDNLDRNFLFFIKSKDLCTLLIKHGIDVNHKDWFGESPLYTHIENNRYEICVCLLKAGADWNYLHLPFDSEKTSLDLAFDLQRLDLVKYFLQHMKINLNTPDEYGSTPLHRAIRREQYDTCKLLIDYGADINHQDKTGNTALHYAASKANNHLICKYLVERGADPGIKNNNSQDPTNMASPDNKIYLENLLEQPKQASKRKRRNAVDYFSAVALPREHILGNYKRERQNIAEANFQDRSYSWVRDTPTTVSDAASQLQNWFLITQLLFQNLMSRRNSRKGEWSGSVSSLVKSNFIIGRMDPLAEDAIGALPDFEEQK